MLNAREVNTILEAVLGTIEEKAKAVGKLNVGRPEAVKTAGTYASVVLGALFTGQLQGKMTLTMDWTTAFTIAEEMTQTKVESFNREVQTAVETVFTEAAARMTASFTGRGCKVNIHPIPTLVDSDALLAEEEKASAIRIPLETPAAALNLYLAFD